MSTAKPKRIKFSEEEKFLILEEFGLHKDILIAKSSWYKNTMAWQCTWEEIVAAVDSLSPLVQRTPDEIRKKWQNMVIDICRELAVEKHLLLHQWPQEKLLHNIFTLFNKPSPGLLELLLTATAFRARTAPPGCWRPPRTHSYVARAALLPWAMGCSAPWGPHRPRDGEPTQCSQRGARPQEELAPDRGPRSVWKRDCHHPPRPPQSPARPQQRCSQWWLPILPRRRAGAQQGWRWCCQPAPLGPPHPSASNACRAWRWCGFALV